jgi:RimJ/RimL family protein N-acetyltransferase
MRTLRASQCTLEPQVEAHAREMFGVLSDPAIYEFENEAPPSEAWLAHRYKQLESRQSTDGSEQWLNWVIRLPGGELAGYVQATVLPSGECSIAYQLASRYWRRGIARSAVQAMLEELESALGVHEFVAVLKAANFRSLAFLRALGFMPANPDERFQHPAESDERIMVKASQGVQNGAGPLGKDH